MTLILDYSFARPDPATIKAAGYSAVMRYLSTSPGQQTNPKDISAPEVLKLHTAGLGIGLVWETTARRAGAGQAAGQADVAAAELLADRLGYPRVCPIFYAVDFDANPDAVAPYFTGIKAKARRPIGVYGSARVVEAIHTAGVPYVWQACAWSNGAVSGINHLYQRISPTVRSAIPNTDENVVMHEFPIWNGTPTVPVVVVKPPVIIVTKPANRPASSVAPMFPLAKGCFFGPVGGGASSISGLYGHAPDLLRWQAQMAQHGWVITVDGHYGPQTARVTAQFQAKVKLKIDSLIGPLTWAAAWSRQ
jgi:peptidoglycan hydrolase-like protein with peptidoglycan-binding domain